jgi:endoribonuclease LACTB2
VHTPHSSLIDSGTNTYLIGTGPKRLLIDTGEGVQQYESVLSSVLEKEKCSIDKVLLTHWHHDHVGGIDQVKTLSSEATFFKFIAPDENSSYGPIQDGEVFEVEGAKIRAVHTPGHTTDHTVFIVEDTGELFTGDSILGQGTAVFECLSTYISSLKKQLDLGPTILYPGHGPVIRGESAASGKIQEYITHRQQREDEIVKVIAEAAGEVTTMDIVKVIYAKYPQSLWPAAERGLLLHLNKLKDEGKAREVTGGKWILLPRNSTL